MQLGNESFHLYLRKFIVLLLILLISTATSARRKLEENSRHPRSNSCRRNHKFDGEEKCNTATNCRYGGMCRKVTDITANGATIRVVVPLDVETTDLYKSDSRGRSRERRRSPSLNPLFQKMERPPEEECVCNFPCNHRHSKPNQEVCGSNGKTYSSECHLRRDSCRCQSDITLRWKGSCENDTSSSDTTNSKSNRKSGKCSKDCKFGAKCDRSGVCRCKIECDVQALSYVCGKDGRTYTNECHVRQSECRYQMEIGVLHEGTCSADERSRRDSQQFQRGKSTVNPCETLDCDAAVADPLCGSDEISYPNECVLRHASCVKEQEILVKHKGYCRQHFDVSVPTTIKPPTTSIVNALETRTDDPCVGIMCHHNAVCIKHEEYDFICSCEAICDRMVSDTVDTPRSDTSFRALAAMWPGARIFEAMVDGEQLASEIQNVKTIDAHSMLESAMLLNKNSTEEEQTEKLDEPEIIRLDEEKDTKPIWTENIDEKIDDIPDRVRVRRRRNRNSRNRRHRGEYHETTRSKRSTGGMRPLFSEILCGTDGKTYMNECELRKEGCYNKKRITIAHIGACSMAIEKSTPSSSLLTSTTASTTTNSYNLYIEEKPEIEKVDIIDESDKRSFEEDYTIFTTTIRPKRRRGEKNKNKRGKNKGKGKRGNHGKRDRNAERKSRSRANASELELRDETVNSDILSNLNLNEELPTPHNIRNTQNNSQIELRDEIVDSKTLNNLGLGETIDSSIETTPKQTTTERQTTPISAQATTRNIVLNESNENVSMDLETREGIVNETMLDALQPELITPEKPSQNASSKSAADTIQERSENVRKNDYISLWKAGKKQELLKNRVILVKKRLENSKNKNSTKQNFAKEQHDKTFKAESGLSAVSLALAIGLGQLAVVIVLVGLFIYMKKRKKLKDLPETKESLKIATEKEKNTNNNKPS